MNLCKLRMKVLYGSRDSVSLRLFEEAKKQYYEILNSQEVLWKQKAKQFWLNARDQNSKYCHAMALVRWRKILISKLRDEDGNWLD